ncbi:MAG: putative dehydrogenase/threonine dehydrogenase-like Zn-dependent dehydrogenase [Planctomycetota bacterium]|jgi:predicted dehydrogenase/threonine dehydrogenase-like Zn-dependent dehydrogenase
MKQVLENFKTGECTVEDVPSPIVRDQFVLVKNHYSLISTGTEGSTVNLGKKNLIGKALARPEQAMKVIQVAKTQGLLVAYNAAMRSLEMPIVLGYCTAGEVIALGQGVSHLKIGDRVACGGAGFANHAEIVCVPKNLCSPMPSNVEMRHAAFTTLGSIALQSIRVANVRLGECVVVIGLGLVGLMVVQLLRAAGCRVFGVDINADRVAFVKNKGYGDADISTASNLRERVSVFCNGEGADAVIITAATEDNGPVVLAGELARRKGRVVAVGRTRMDAPRDTYLFKELELCTSMAYGPGTGDPSYELEGQDYPYAYVRWSEGRNMAGVLNLIADGSLQLEDLVTHEFDIDDADQAFALITGKTGQRSTAVLLKYPVKTPAQETNKQITLVNNMPAREGIIRCGVIGAGSFATNEFLPLLVKQGNIELRSIASATGVRAHALGKKYGFSTCSSDAMSIIEDESIDCVFILTRHDTHANLSAAALRAGKHVFVEKPLSLNIEELKDVEVALEESAGLLMVGFNRRYAPLAGQMKKYFGQRAQPASIVYRVNVGHRPAEHWLHHPEQGGGVVLGEACHHIDFCNWMIGKAPVEIIANKLESNCGGFIAEDNVHVTIRYTDGSIAHVAYLSNGSKAYNTERVEFFCDNKVATLTDFKKLEMAKGMTTKTRRIWIGNGKGHAEQIGCFFDVIRGGTENSIDSASYISSMKTVIEVDSLI